MLSAPERWGEVWLAALPYSICEKQHTHEHTSSLPLLCLFLVSFLYFMTVLNAQLTYCKSDDSGRQAVTRFSLSFSCVIFLYKLYLVGKAINSKSSLSLLEWTKLVKLFYLCFRQTKYGETTRQSTHINYWRICEQKISQSVPYIPPLRTTHLNRKRRRRYATQFSSLPCTISKRPRATDVS